MAGGGVGGGGIKKKTIITMVRENSRNSLKRIKTPPVNQYHFQSGNTEIDPNPNEELFYTPLTAPTAAEDSTGLRFFTYEASHVYETSDGAGSWNQIGDIGTNIDGSKIAGFRQSVHGLGVSPVDTLHLSVIGFSGRIALTRNGGGSWRVQNLISLVPGWTGFNANIAYANNNVILVASESPTPGAV